MIQFYLTASEGRHYRDLFEGAGTFRMAPDLDEKAINERKLVTLESVIPYVSVRSIAGKEPVQVIITDSFSHRWKRV